MMYQGAKSHLARRICDAISRREVQNCTQYSRNNRGGTCLVSLFCGSCAVETRLAPLYDRVICADAHPYLIAMWQAVQAGRDLPDTVTEAEYQHIRANRDEDPALTGFVGFACSFGGKFFGGYARDHRCGRNYAAVGKSAVLRDIQTLRGAEFVCGDYRSIDIPEGAVVYCDPPYDGTTGYTTGRFDSAAFWDYMRQISQTHRVYISEQTAPDDFEAIWEAPLRRSLDMQTDRRKIAMERLYIYRGGKNA